MMNYNMSGSLLDSKAIYKQVSTEIKRLGSDHKAIQQLEALVNRYQSNIMQVIRHNLPNMNDIDSLLGTYSQLIFNCL